MTLEQLLQITAQKASWARWKKQNAPTMLKDLAGALGCTDPCQCDEQHYSRPLDVLLQVLTCQLAKLEKAPDRVRMERSLLRQLFHDAVKYGVLSPLPKESEEKQLTNELPPPLQRSKLCPKFYPQSFGDKVYAIPPDRWPKPIREWSDRCKDKGLQRGIRMVTVDHRIQAIKNMIGYLVKERGFLLHKITIPDLYHVEHLEGYASWSQIRTGRKGLTTAAQQLFNGLIGLPEGPVGMAPETWSSMQDKVRALRREYRVAMAAHDKNLEITKISLQDLDAIGRALIDQARQPLTATRKEKRTVRPAVSRAISFRDGLMFLLITRVPMRQRAFREMTDKNLTRQDDKWIIRFRETEKKVAYRKGKPDVWQVPFPVTLVGLLEEYLNIHRKVLTNGVKTDFIFLGKNGAPLITEVAYSIFRQRAAQYGKTFYPHLIRTLWPSTMARNAMDVRAVARMMDDSIQTIFEKYYVQSDGLVLDHAAEMIETHLCTDNKGKAPLELRTTISPSGKKVGFSCPAFSVHIDDPSSILKGRALLEQALSQLGKLAQGC